MRSERDIGVIFWAPAAQTFKVSGLALLRDNVLTG